MSRCRALARVLRTDARVTFMLDPGGDAWRPSLLDDGFEVRFPADAPAGRAWRGCIVDSYGVTDQDLVGLKQAAGWLAAFEDGLRPHPLVDLAINGAPGLTGDRLGDTPALLGERYAILPEGFVAVAPAAPRRTIQRVLISFGYRDDADLCGRAVAAFDRFAARQLDLVVAIGSGGAHLEALRRRAASSPHRVELRLDARNMAELLRAADLAIGAGGVSLYERMAAGVPSVTIVAAENQRLIAEGAHAAGATLCLGQAENLSPDAILGAVLRLDRSPEERARLAESGRRLIDGRGAERVAAALRAFAERRLAAAGQGA